MQALNALAEVIACPRLSLCRKPLQQRSGPSVSISTERWPSRILLSTRCWCWRARIRYGGEGDVGRVGGPKGDLYVILSIRPHDYCERHGADLHCVLPISFPQAAMGDEFEIPGIDGPVNLKIPEGTQSGRELRIRGRGVPYLNDKGNGDLIVKVVVQIPRKLNRAQRELVAKLAETMTADNKPTAPGLMEKMKDLFG